MEKHELNRYDGERCPRCRTGILEHSDTGRLVCPECAFVFSESEPVTDAYNWKIVAGISLIGVTSALLMTLLAGYKAANGFTPAERRTLQSLSEHALMPPVDPVLLAVASPAIMAVALVTVLVLALHLQRLEAEAQSAWEPELFEDDDG